MPFRWRISIWRRIKPSDTLAVGGTGVALPDSRSGEQSKTALVARALWRRARRRLRVGPRYGWRFSGRIPDRVRVAPPDLRLADARIAHEIYSSRFPLAGHVIDTGGASPFRPDTGPPGWEKALNSFRWLRHLSAARTDLAAHNARALVADWIATSGLEVASRAWEPGTTAKRVIAWLQHSSLILSGAELPFYRVFLASLAMQVRYLRAVAPEMEIGKDRLRARIALAFASLSLPTSGLRSAARHLDTELERQILGDGGHISRNPLTVMELLADLLPLRQTYINQAVLAPRRLPESIDRMMQILRFFRHADGSLARFNGMGMTIHDRVNAILRHDGPATATLLQAPSSGYDRLAIGQTVIIMDTGSPPPVDASTSAHAGCLSFEMSSGRSALIVNCGVDSYGERQHRELARSTAAHSTATLEETSQASFEHTPQLRRFIGSPLLGGARKVDRRRQDSASEQSVCASHDAYLARFGIVHERELRLGGNGADLLGTDRFIGKSSAAAAIRFHLNPEVGIYLPDDGGIGLAPHNDAGWLFFCKDAEVEIEDSIFFAAPDGPMPTRQLVIWIENARDREIAWRFIRQ